MHSNSSLEYSSSLQQFPSTNRLPDVHLYNSHHGFAFHSVTSILTPAVCGVLRHSNGIVSLPMYCMNMLFNLPAQFIYLFIFIFSFISFLFNVLFFQVETSCCLVASAPESALCSQSTFYPLCLFSCFSVSSWEGKLQNWHFSQYSRCYCSITVFSVLFCILFMSNFLNTVAFWVFLSCCVKKGKLQIVFHKMPPKTSVSDRTTELRSVLW